MQKVEDKWILSHVGKYSQEFVRHEYLKKNKHCFDQEKHHLQSTTPNFDQWHTFEAKQGDCMAPFFKAPLKEIVESEQLQELIQAKKSGYNCLLTCT